MKLSFKNILCLLLLLIAFHAVAGHLRMDKQQKSNEIVCADSTRVSFKEKRLWKVQMSGTGKKVAAPVVAPEKSEPVKTKNNSKKKTESVTVNAAPKAPKMFDENKVSDKVLQDSADVALQNSFIRNAQLADSIWSMNKSWYDSVSHILPAKAPVQIYPGDDIEIYISGGGLYKGVNPKMYDRLIVFNTGLIQRDYKTLLQGEQHFEKKVSHEELAKLAKYIVDMGFFDFNKTYECPEIDGNCKERLKNEPDPIPLFISVKIGMRRHKVNIDFYAPNMEPNYVNYPPAVEKIITAIFDLAEEQP